MNLRTLKKLSKRAAILLAQLGDSRKQFRAERLDNYTSLLVADRKHWERAKCHPSFEARNDWSTPRGADRPFTTRAGQTMIMRPPSHPRKGTVMVGSMVGYYEPEWEEETAYEALCGRVYNEFSDWTKDGSALLRCLDTPSDIFRAARDLNKRKPGDAPSADMNSALSTSSLHQSLPSVSKKAGT